MWRDRLGASWRKVHRSAELLNLDVNKKLLKNVFSLVQDEIW